MKPYSICRVILVHTLLLLWLSLCGQEFREYIRMQHVLDVSQKTNAYLRRSGDLVFISSTDGLNVLHGQNMRVLRSGHGLFDSNVQSDFFADTKNRVWFCTFTGFYSYDLVTGNIVPFRVADHKGDTLISEYRIAGLAGSNLLIQNGEELICFDTDQTMVTHRWYLGSCVLCNFSIQQTEGGFHLVAGNLQGAEALELNRQSGITSRTRLLSSEVNGVLEADGTVWLLEATGILHQVFDGRLVLSLKLSGTPISFRRHGGNLLINFGGYFTYFHMHSKQESPPIRVYYDNDRISDILDLQIDHDSILWISAEGAGVYSTRLNLDFRDFLREEYTVDPPVTAMIGSTEDGSHIILFSTNRGVIVLTPDGQLVAEYHRDQEFQLIDSRNISQYGDAILYYDAVHRTVKLLNITNNTTRALHYAEPGITPSFYKFCPQDGNTLIASSHTLGLGFMTIHKESMSYTFESFGKSAADNIVYTFFYLDRNRTLYASYNEEAIHVFTPTDRGSYHFEKAVPVAGGIWGLYHYPGDSLVYIGNTRGLFSMHTSTFSWKDLNDARYLPAAINYVAGDTLRRLWMSTNQGILRYNIASGATDLFTEKDGVSSSEFISHSFYQDSMHRMYFGGTEGVTVFQPYQVTHATRAAPVDVYGFNINDVPSDKFLDGVTKSLSLPYDQRTLSFEIQTIDYAAPEETRVRYKMTQYDRDWVTSTSSRGFARYANMRPGQYTFSIQGMNVDGILNDTIKEIQIRIIPPFYMTWWFRLLMILAGLGLVYLSIQMYYRRKLERKDMQLKEQSLQIEKQTAVERERNRIAAEMHDDLGAGLTRIKFLSERALKHTRDADEAEEISRIAEQSNHLVTNMSEIIWAMNSRFDTMESLAGYIRRYASEYLEEHGINFAFLLEPGQANPVVTAEKRRNVFLVVKELLHNTVKYSGAQAVEMQIAYNAARCTLMVIEKNVEGFDPVASLDKGNGLYNMQKRITGIGGELQFTHEPPDMTFTLLVPLEHPGI